MRTLSVKSGMSALFGLICCLLAPATAHAQFNLNNALSINSSVFYNPETGQPYVETCVNIHGKGLRYLPASEGQYRAGAVVTLMLKESDDKIVDYLKYKLESPEVEDSTTISFSLMDQRRLPIPKRGLSLEVLVEDEYNADNKFSKTSTLNSGFETGVMFSDVLFVDTFYSDTKEAAFVKNGMTVMPRAINFFPNEKNTLTWYTEIYNTGEEFGEGEGFLITASIREHKAEKVNSNFWQYHKKTAASVVPVMLEFDMKQLPTGNYDLVMEVRNKQNELLLEKRRFFQRLNKASVESLENIAMLNTSYTWVDKYDPEQLDAFIKFLKPVASQAEQNIITSIQNLPDTSIKKSFLYNYWLRRAPDNSYGAWLDYLKLVKKTNDLFTTTAKQGYRTDRGRVMLQYGVPSDVQAMPSEPGAYPYEIWHFYDLPDGQTNIQFVFYEPTLVSEDYKLIHSNAIGELQDPRWQLRIYENVADPTLLNNPDATTPLGSYGNGAGLFEDNFGGNRTNGGGPE